jgi:hypothetical protein
LKGHGLCHGIPGNGYAFHCIFRTLFKLTEQMEEGEDNRDTYNNIAQLWRTRTYQFAEALSKKENRSLCKKFDDGTRK